MATRRARFEDNELAPTSRAGYAAYLAGEHPRPESLGGDLFTLSLPLPVEGIATSTLSYIYRDGRGVGHIVDPGWETEENWARLTGALRAWGIHDVETVVATHLHDDHLGMADRVRREFGARLALSRLEWEAVRAGVFDEDPADALRRWGAPDDVRIPTARHTDPFANWADPDLLLEDGDTVDFGRPIRVVLTPGHSQGGIVLVDQQGGRILTGDHVMPHLNPGLGMGYVGEADPVGDYFESAEALLQWDGCEVLSGHGYRFGRLGVRIRQHIGHHLRRARQVAEIFDGASSTTVWDAASQLPWSVGWENLDGYFRLSALAQTAMHLRFVRDTARSARWLDSASY